MLATAGSLIAEFQPGVNLLTNGSATAPLATGWTVIAAGGNGWSNTSTGGYDATGGYFITSFGLCQRSQTIDLLAKGFTPEELDKGAPLRVSEAISEYYQNSVHDTYYIKVELRDAAGAVLDKWEAGTSAVLKPAVNSWVVESHEFRDYGPGLRTIYFEDGGVDEGFWAQFYGTYHDAATVEFINSPPSDIVLTPATIGEGTPAGGIVGQLTATDPDHTVHTFALEPDVTTETAPLLTQGAAGWRYWDQAAAPQGDWTGILFDDSAWTSGTAPLGYDSNNADAWLVTKINYGADPANKPITAYFRTTFNVTDPQAITALTCTLQIDDGCVAYLNGHELFRDGIADGVAVTNTTLASRSISGGDENDFDPVTITPDKLAYLRAGVNVLAIEVHQQAANSSDMTLDINLNAVSLTASNNYSNGLFEVVGTELRVKDGSASLVPGDYTVRVKAMDPAGAAFAKLLTVQRNTTTYTFAPTDITMTSSPLPENSPAGTIAGTLSVVDGDAGQAHRFELVAGAGGEDNAKVTIAGNRVFLAESPDFEAGSSLKILVKVTDSTGLSFTKALNIQITDVTTEDQDADGLTEAEEDVNGNGVMDAGETDPFLADTDGDGFSDRVERQAGSDPRSAASIPTGVPVNQITTHATGDSWLTAASWDGGQVPTGAQIAISDNLTFRSPPALDPVFPALGVDLRNGAIFRMKHSGLCSIGRIVLRNATLQQGMTTAIGVGGGATLLEVPDADGVTPDGIIDTATAPLELRASLTGAGSVSVIGTTGLVRLLSPAVSFTGELSIDGSQVVVVHPSALTGSSRIDVKAGTFSMETAVSLPAARFEVSGTGKLNMSQSLTVGGAVLGGVTIPNGIHTSAALTALGVPAAAIESGSGTLTVGSTVSEGDSDGDGMSDVMEAIAQTNPHDAADFLRIRSVNPLAPGNKFRLLWTAVPGVTYTVQYSGDTSAGWQDINVVTPATSLGAYDVVLTPPLPGKFFFRLAVKTP
jgi:hypothetical protein